MANKDDLIIDGYFFGSYDDAKQANKEIKNARYLEERVASMSARQKKALYDKMLDEKVFNTPVGWEYLKYLRKRMIDEGISEDDIRPIPLYVTLTTKNQDDKDYSHIAKMHVNTGKSYMSKIKEQLKWSVVVNVFLVIIVLAMFFIAMNSSSPNIINYKTVILDEYATWEQELKDREDKIAEKERQLSGKEDNYEDFSG